MMRFIVRFVSSGILVQMFVVVSALFVGRIFLAHRVVATSEDTSPIAASFPKIDNLSSSSGEKRRVFDAEMGLSWEIFLADRQANEVRLLTNDFASDRFPVLSPDSTRVAFVSWRDGNAEVYLLNLETGALQNISRDPSNDLLQTWSPDGTMLAFVSERDGNAEIYLADVAHGFLTNLTRNPAHDTSPQWDKDSTLTFKSNRDGELRAYCAW